MNELTYTEAMRLRSAFSLAGIETAILVSVLEREIVPREEMFQRVRASGSKRAGYTSKTFDVILCKLNSKLNSKLPGAVRIEPIYVDGKSDRYSTGRPRKQSSAIGYALRSEGARREFWAIARPTQQKEQAA